MTDTFKINEVALLQNCNDKTNNGLEVTITGILKEYTFQYSEINIGHRVSGIEHKGIYVAPLYMLKKLPPHSTPSSLETLKDIWVPKILETVT